MYTRSTPSGNDELRIPENYSGNAFHGDTMMPAPPVDPPSESLMPPIEESVAVKEEALPAVVAADPPKDVPVMKRTSPFSSLLPPRLLGSGGGLLGDIGIEELLIIGVLILLSQSETDDDILLLLVLLLFYK